MRTTLVVDDDLYRRAKSKAALEGRKVTELVEEGLRLVLRERPSGKMRRRRVRLPLVARPAGAPRFNLTPERLLALERAAEDDTAR